ncbi:MAG: restriction endonuclease subunit S [Sediminibacterium sp.]
MNKVNQNKLMPKLRFPEFKNDDSWEIDNIENIFISFSGGTPNTSVKEYYGGNIPFIRSAEINRAITELFITEQGLKNSSAKLINKGDLLIALYGANSGDAAIAKIEGAINQAILCLRSEYSNTFAYYYFSLKKDWLISNYIQGGQGNLSGEIIKSFRFCFPKKQEQQKIAACLSSLDDLITAENQKLETLKAHKNGLLQNLFPAEGETVPKLRFNTTGYWEEKPLGKIAQNLNSKRIPITENLRIKGNIPYIGASGIIDYVKDYIFDDDLLCISEDGANLLMRTYPIAFSITGKTWVNNHAHVLKFENKYIQIIVENQLNNKNLEDFLTGMAQPKLNRAKLDLIPIQIPVSTEEQQKIASHLTASDSLITLQTQKIESLKLHKKGLMQGLFPDTTEITA